MISEIQFNCDESRKRKLKYIIKASFHLTLIEKDIMDQYNFSLILVFIYKIQNNKVNLNELSSS